MGRNDDKMAVVTGGASGTGKACSRLLSKGMAAISGGLDISMSSVTRLRGLEGHALYGASKGALRTRTRGVAMEYAGQGIRVNSVHPAYIETQMATYGAEAQDASKTELGQMHPMGHIGEPAGVVHSVLLLGSDESKFATGDEPVIDGGYNAQ